MSGEQFIRFVLACLPPGETIEYQFIGYQDGDYSRYRIESFSSCATLFFTSARLLLICYPNPQASKRGVAAPASHQHHEWRWTAYSDIERVIVEELSKPHEVICQCHIGDGLEFFLSPQENERRLEFYQVLLKYFPAKT